MSVRRSNLVMALASAVTLALAGALLSPVQAWKPYTHTWSAEQVRIDAADGSVEVAGRGYPLDRRVARALRTKPRHYRAGVVGPDAFPDLTMGQSVIHPWGGDDPGEGSTTGAWLQHVLDRAWDAQGDRRYSLQEQLAILAWAYGFLTHAAGDMWAHTFVNEHAGGVFPELADAASDTEKAAIVLRHLVVEGYVGDATRGFDGNPDRQPVEGGVSDDSTPAVGFAAPPDLWIWETFVKRPKVRRGPYANRLFLDRAWGGQPTSARGPMIEWFYALHNQLVRTAITEDGGLPWGKRKVRRRVAACVAAPCRVRVVMRQAMRRYALEWSEDIAEGLERWGRVGESFARGLFDPAVRRQAQDHVCRNSGDESGNRRGLCEKGVSTVDAMLWDLQDRRYLTTEGPRLGSMLGAPDRFLRIWDRFSTIMEWLEDRLAVLVPPRLAELVTDIKEFFKEKLTQALVDILGFDFVTYLDALSHPGTYLSNGYDRDLSGPLAYFNDHDLFPEDALDTINEQLGLGPVALDNGRLPDEAELDPTRFAALANTDTMARLTLLRGDQLDMVLSDLLGRRISTYSIEADTRASLRRRNVMTTGLDGVPWLRSIDSDHAWRRDGQPISCTPTLEGSCEADTEAVSRPNSENGGTGMMPVWESCVLRPAFRDLFSDWQRKGAFEPFPDYGDDTSADPVNDPRRPEVSLIQTSGSRSGSWVSAGSEFLFQAQDRPRRRSFGPADLSILYLIDDGPQLQAPSPWTYQAPATATTVRVAYQGADPCHGTRDSKDVLVLQVDPDPPTQRCPVNVKAVTDETWPVAWEVDDALSGVRSATALVEDFQVAGRTATLDHGDPLAGYDLGPGYHPVTTTATDAVGNEDVNDECGVFVSATSTSLRANLDEARSRGDVSQAGFATLAPVLNDAVAAQRGGDTSAETAALESFVAELDVMEDEDLAAEVRDRWSAHAEELLRG